MMMINNDNKILKDIIIEYEKTTDTTLSTEKMTFTLGDVSSWTARQALESLEYEPEGNLAILLLKPGKKRNIKKDYHINKS